MVICSNSSCGITYGVLQWVAGYIIIIIIAAAAHRHRSFTIQSSHGRASVVIEINYFRLVIGEPRLVLVMLCWASMSATISSEDYTLFGCVCCHASGGGGCWSGSIIHHIGCHNELKSCKWVSDSNFNSFPSAMDVGEEENRRRWSSAAWPMSTGPPQCTAWLGIPILGT